MNVLRLRVTDDMPMAARVLVWPRDPGGYFIYVRPGTPRGSVRSALRALKDMSAARREMTVIAFAAKDAWRSPRERVMSFGAGLATTVVSGGLATSVAVTGMAVTPNLHHHGKSLLPSWADLDPVPDSADRAGKPAPSIPQHPAGSRPVTPSQLPQSHSGTSSRAVDLPSRAPAARGHLAPGTPSDRPNKGAKEEARKPAKPAKPGKPAPAGPAKKAVKPAKKAKARTPKPAKPSGHADKR